MKPDKMQFRLADVAFNNLDPMPGVFALLTGGWLHVRSEVGVISYPAARVSDVRWQSEVAIE